MSNTKQTKRTFLNYDEDARYFIEKKESFYNDGDGYVDVPDDILVKEFKSEIEYKYDEDNAMAEIQAYIDNTYSQHYAQTGVQATEFIIDAGHGEGFCIGNVLKYAQRYGRKDGKNRQDLMKVIHYAIVALSINNTQEKI